MSITQHNYELFILDYYEGKLDAATTRELMLFFDQNPEARDAFESYETILLTPDLSQHFVPKSSLKKTAIIAVGKLNEENYEASFVDSIENNLSSNEIENLNEFIDKNPQLKKTLDDYKKTLLPPDLSIVFEGKEQLKKMPVIPLRPAPVRKLLQISVSVAAILVVILLSGIIISYFNNTDKNGSSSFSAINLNNAVRQTISPEKQKISHYIPQSANHISNQTGSKIITFADVNLSDNRSSIDKLQIKKETHIETQGNKEVLASVPLIKRNEYTNLINERELITNRRIKSKQDAQEEGLADYVVNGIKNAARTSTHNKEDIKDNKKIGFWDVAGFGVFAYNKITNNNLSLHKETDASGRLMSFNLEDKNSQNEDKK